MNSRDVVRRLRAFDAGRPLPRGETMHIHIADPDDVLILAFVRMGGESRPWGIAYGLDGQAPVIEAVAEARDRDAVAAMAARMAPTLLEHLRTPGYCEPAPASADDLLPLRQVWVPNPTHLDMLHHLNYAYTFARYNDPPPELNALGRACGFLFREAQRPGQMSTIVATEALRSAFTFPAEDVRQGHLGFLLAWLNAKGGREARLAAAMEAERRSIATSLDPSIERDEIQRALERFHRAKDEGKTKEVSRATRQIADRLGEELERRWMLTAEAVARLRKERRRANRGLERLVGESAQEQWGQYERIELKLADPDNGPVFIPSVETDRHPAAAGARYQIFQASADLADSVLVHDDAELRAEVVADGHAFVGEIVAVDDLAEGTRGTRPMWTLRDTTNAPLRLRAGSHVSVVGFPGRHGQICSIEEAADGARMIEVEITALKTRRADAPPPHDLRPTDAAWLGEYVTFVKKPAGDIARQKARAIWDTTGPGAWLTHRRPGGAFAQVTDTDDDIDDAVEVQRAEGLA